MELTRWSFAIHWGAETSAGLQQCPVEAMASKVDYDLLRKRTWILTVHMQLLITRVFSLPHSSWSSMGLGVHTAVKLWKHIEPSTVCRRDSSIWEMEML
jgi:hypothetical protein